VLGNKAQDQGQAQYDALDEFGAGVAYRVDVARPASVAPQYLTVSNKPSEHNIANMGAYVAKSQQAAQTMAPDISRRLSYPVSLPASMGVSNLGTN